MTDFSASRSAWAEASRIRPGDAGVYKDWVRVGVNSGWLRLVAASGGATSFAGCYRAGELLAARTTHRENREKVNPDRASVATLFQSSGIDLTRPARLAFIAQWLLGLEKPNKKITTALITDFSKHQSWEPSDITLDRKPLKAKSLRFGEQQLTLCMLDFRTAFLAVCAIDSSLGMFETLTSFPEDPLF